MEESGLFIKKFSTKDNLYIYDVNTNKIFQVNEIVFDIIDEVGISSEDEIINKYVYKYKPDNIKKNFNKIKNYFSENGKINNKRPNISFKIKSIKDVKNELSEGLEHLVISITERCNLRCKYCAFSGKYSYNRTHTKKDISFSIAKQAIDFYLKRCKEIPTIGFYGGEPLLKFGMIKKIVDYSKRKNEKCRFNITTNGTLLNKEIIDFFYNKNMTVLISLDGPEEIHNRYRVFPNGNGTFFKIIKNLKDLKNRDERYFQDKISLNVVLAPPYRFDLINDFFFKRTFLSFQAEHIQLTFIDPNDTTFFSDFKLEDEEKKRNEKMLKLRRHYKESIINGEYDNIKMEKKFFTRPFYRIDRRQMKPLGEYFAPQGTCFPGKRSLFVDVEGNFSICEKIGNNYIIGDVRNGFYYERIYYFLKKYESFFKDCKYCWALRLCMKCFNNIRKGGNFSIKKREEFCKSTLFSILMDLIDYCEIKEKDKEAFKEFDNIYIA